MAYLVREGKIKIFFHFFLFKVLCSMWEQSLVSLQKKGKSQNVPRWCLLGEDAKQTLVLWFYNLNACCSLKYPSVFTPSQNLISVMVGKCLLLLKWNTYCHIACIQEESCLFWKTIMGSTGSLVSSLPILFTVLIWIFLDGGRFFYQGLLG